jgi:hypothetical protein
MIMNRTAAAVGSTGKILMVGWRRVMSTDGKNERGQI